MRIVLDTNVIVSGLLHPAGNPGQILALAFTGFFRVCISEEIFAEYSEVLFRPRFKFDPEKVKAILDRFAADGVWIAPSSRQSFGLPDPDDEIFLSIALDAPADFLITGNLKDYPPDKRHGCSVVSPGDFLEWWKKILQTN